MTVEVDAGTLRGGCQDSFAHESNYYTRMKYFGTLWGRWQPTCVLMQGHFWVDFRITRELRGTFAAELPQHVNGVLLLHSWRTCVEFQAKFRDNWLMSGPTCDSGRCFSGNSSLKQILTCIILTSLNKTFKSITTLLELLHPLAFWPWLSWLTPLKQGSLITLQKRFCSGQ